MVETGDWLIPRTPDGEVRLKKPVIPYWFSAAGFEILGIGVPGFRLFWVLAACGILLLTYAIARALGASPGVAILAELMIAANPVFMRAATNAIPDIPLTLFVTAAALGFVRILAARQRCRRARLGMARVDRHGARGADQGPPPARPRRDARRLCRAAFDRGKLGAILRPLPMLRSPWRWSPHGTSMPARPTQAEFAAQFFGDQISGNATRGPPSGCSPPSPATSSPASSRSSAGRFSSVWLAARSRTVPSPAAWPSPAPAARAVVRRGGGRLRLQRRDRPPLPAARAAGLLRPVCALGIGPSTATACRTSRALPLAAPAGGRGRPAPRRAGGADPPPDRHAARARADRPRHRRLAARRARSDGADRGSRRISSRATPVLAVSAARPRHGPGGAARPWRPVCRARSPPRTCRPASRAFVGDIHIASEVRLQAGAAEPFVEVRQGRRRDRRGPLPGHGDAARASRTGSRRRASP